MFGGMRYDPNSVFIRWDLIMFAVAVWGPTEQVVDNIRSMTVALSPDSLSNLLWCFCRVLVCQLQLQSNLTPFFAVLQELFKMAQARTTLGPLAENWQYPNRCRNLFVSCTTCSRAWQAQKCGDEDAEIVSPLNMGSKHKAHIYRKALSTM